MARMRHLAYCNPTKGAEMTNTKTTPFGRIREILNDVNYAQRRLTEIRTGVSLTTRPKHADRHGA